MDSIIGKQFTLDLGSTPVKVLVKEITDNEVVTEYLQSWPGRIERFSIESFEHFTGVQIRNR